jgi:hypothetical protein
MMRKNTSATDRFVVTYDFGNIALDTSYGMYYMRP